MVYAIAAVTLLTILIGVLAVRARLSCVRSGEVPAGYFKLMQGEALPERMIKTGRCYNNMFEVPCLFYVVGTLYIVSGVENTAGLILAWAFVFFRSAQAWVHLTRNNVRYRMYLYGGGILCVLLLWINLLIERA
ncbi:MAPEG family protein [Amphritea pacifica]|uniref:MAPEG family protein n=1 Tax=Amphritea pacifica TaxID=2811233 RepID=UPI001965949A|nr:MAPEG family protein [Amphritea pacifica]MBN1006100.1 MAPEG family protein [Amphritea pacifica]